MPPRLRPLLLRVSLWVLVGSSSPALLRDRSKENGLQLPRLCKFCDIKATTCSNQYQCKSNCNITSICEKNNEVCAAVWRRNDENVTLETICHDPQKRLYGHMLDDSSSEQCVMKEKKDDGGLMFMCSCTGEECNDVLIFSADRFRENGLQLPKLCKFCDIKATTCSNQYQCKSNCNITSICEKNNEVCAAVWRRNDENVTLETICHDPQKRLYGHMLDDSSSEQCVMKEKKDDGGLMFMCSCTGEECNDVLIFSAGYTVARCAKTKLEGLCPSRPGLSMSGTAFSTLPHLFPLLNRNPYCCFLTIWPGVAQMDFEGANIDIDLVDPRPRCNRLPCLYQRESVCTEKTLLCVNCLQFLCKASLTLVDLG